jgi:hypothetical protein
VPTRSGSKKRSGAWKPVLPQAGYYEVVVKIPSQHATSRKATYRIKTADGWVSRVRSQKKRQGEWVGLGVHKLTTTPIVKLADKTGETGSLGRRLAFDVARFVPTTAPAGVSVGARAPRVTEAAGKSTVRPRPVTSGPDRSPLPSVAPEAEAALTDGRSVPVATPGLAPESSPVPEVGRAADPD